MPLTWDEVNDALDPTAFTIRTAVERMEALATDPVRPVIDDVPDLGAVLERLGGLVAGGSDAGQR
jgi:DNA primase